MATSNFEPTITFNMRGLESTLATNLQAFTDLISGIQQLILIPTVGAALLFILIIYHVLARERRERRREAREIEALNMKKTMFEQWTVEKGLGKSMPGDVWLKK